MMAEYARFDMIYIGIYSTRPGTLGAKKYVDNIDRLVKKTRHARLNDLLRTISDTNNIQEI
jgi:tRNA A37 methylthiotransferase MiaB